MSKGIYAVVNLKGTVLYSGEDIDEWNKVVKQRRGEGLTSYYCRRGRDLLIVSKRRHSPDLTKQEDGEVSVFEAEHEGLIQVLKDFL
jgi:hypothetical protein